MPSRTRTERVFSGCALERVASAVHEQCADDFCWEENPNTKLAAQKFPNEELCSINATELESKHSDYFNRMVLDKVSAPVPTSNCSRLLVCADV
jgi:hypothetical protein